MRILKRKGNGASENMCRDMNTQPRTEAVKADATTDTLILDLMPAEL